MRRRLPVARAAAYLVPLLVAASAWVPREIRASWIESLVMPGEVARKHARFERECKKCHAPFDKTAQDRLCLDCHTDVAADAKTKRGYHGRDAAVQDRPCKACHGEHHGRAASIVRLNRHTFDHRLTDLPLRGGHERVPCEDCHADGKRFREAPAHCRDCHARKDPHVGSLGGACDRCHDETSWKKVRFEHGSSAFPLEGKHRGVRCEGCHATKRYKPTSSTCFSCHERNDKHRGGLGRDCQSCHTARAWSGVRFDHARRTRFPLAGKHARAACEGCHSDRLAPERLPTACRDCHERDDAHRGRFGSACQTCHGAIDWRRPTFEHGRDTRYPLRGRHRDVRCPDCHRGRLYEDHLDPSCNACHHDDDVHHGREGTRCDDCHDERGWSRGVLFDHGTTSFPLTGAHARVACKGCHPSVAFKEVERECLGCHEHDDVHHGRKGPRCERCHDAFTFHVEGERR